MHLKVGELARATGLTVRTLHHYDAIGLLRPSARSDAGYRLYTETDVARLHAIQALRLLGLPLAELQPLLDGQGASPETILQQQLRALDGQIREATQLRERLALLHEGLLRGESPTMDDWVRSLGLMATYGKYFDAGELRDIFQRFRAMEVEWRQLLARVREVMDADLAIDTPEVQALTRRWLMLMHEWMRGDYALMERWGEMYRREPAAHGARGAPPPDMLAYIERAITLRLGLLREHFEDHELRKVVGPVPDTELQRIEDDGRKLLETGKPPGGAAARAVARRWLGLLERAAGGDLALASRFARVQEAHPLLLAGSPISPQVRAFLRTAREALDPHAA